MKIKDVLKIFGAEFYNKLFNNNSETISKHEFVNSLLEKNDVSRTLCSITHLTREMIELFRAWLA